MSILGLDTFIRADHASSWGNASDGQSWTKTGPGTISIASNKGKIVSNGSDTHVQLGSKVDDDMEVSCRIIIGHSGDICGVQARFTAGGGATTTYKLLWYGGAIHLNKGVAGANTQMTAVSFTMTPGTAYWFRLRVVKESGTNLFGKIWQDGTAEPGTWTTTTSDSAVTGTGGFAVLGSTNGASTGILYDNFMAVDSPTSSESAGTDNPNITGIVTIISETAEIDTVNIIGILIINDTNASLDTIEVILVSIVTNKYDLIVPTGEYNLIIPLGEYDLFA